MSIYEAKTHLSQLVDQAAAGEDVIIARNGRPLVRLCPVQRTVRKREPGAWKGKGWIASDFDDTPKEIIDLFYGEADAE